MTPERLAKLKRKYRKAPGVVSTPEIMVINELLVRIEKLEKLELMHSLKKLIDEYDNRPHFMPCRDLTPVEFELYKIVKVIIGGNNE
jgi:hypothetical protein